MTDTMIHEVVITRGDRRVLDGVSLAIEPGRVLAVVGRSGSGKSTMLAALAGTIPLDGGCVAGGGEPVGLVPQDDILHLDLPLRRTLLYAAALRGVDDADRAVDEVLHELGLAEVADVTVGNLSGGQRKRASIAVELLAHPGLLLLDEPTAGLDPATAAALLRTLRRLADDGRAVVLTTHNTGDLAAVDEVAVLEGGRIVHVGDAATAIAALAPGDEAPAPRAVAAAGDRPPAVAGPSWWALARRNAEVLARGRLTLMILLGTPIAIIGMFAVLFRAGTDVTAEPTVAFWLAFAGFFFGLTYGLLQVVTEVAVARRERFAGVGIGAYVAAKAVVLVPVLAAVDLLLVTVLCALDRLPGDGVGGTASLVGLLLLDSVAALFLGLLVSAVVTDASQAALALPLACFPAVLFAGAIVPVPDMAFAGQAISVVTPARWAYEAVGSSLDVAAPGVPGSAWPAAVALVVFAAALAAGALAAVDRRLSPAAAAPSGRGRGRRARRA